MDVVHTEVAAGRAASVSAWVGDAVRRKALARAELLDDLDRSETADPYRHGDLEWIPAVVVPDRAWVAERLRGNR